MRLNKKFDQFTLLCVQHKKYLSKLRSPLEKILIKFNNGLGDSNTKMLNGYFRKKLMHEIKSSFIIGALCLLIKERCRKCTKSCHSR